MTVDLVSPGTFTVALFVAWALFSSAFLVGLVKIHRSYLSDVRKTGCWETFVTLYGVGATGALIAAFVSWYHLCW